MAKFEPGHKKIEGAGRKKGKPNKITSSLIEILEKANYCPAAEILKILQNPKALISTADKVRFNLELMSYIYPKRKSIEVKDDTGKEEKFSFKLAYTTDEK